MNYAIHIRKISLKTGFKLGDDENEDDDFDENYETLWTYMHLNTELTP